MNLYCPERYTNGRLLLELGWSGVWFEADSDAIEAIKVSLSPHLRDAHLKLIEGHVVRETIANQIRSHLAGAHPDFLSIDIDYNTSHVWAALADLRPVPFASSTTHIFRLALTLKCPMTPMGAGKERRVLARA